MRRGHGEKLTRKMQQAISALLEKPNVKAAAEMVGVNEATLYRWQKLPVFQQAFHEAKRRILELTITRIQLAGDEAIKTLKSVAQDEKSPSGARVRGALPVF